MRNAKFGPIGRCIYCDYDDPQGFTDEHIIPESLGQTAIVREASCHKCATITSQFERYCAQELFKELRVHHGIKGKKRRKKQTVAHLPIKVEIAGRQELRDVPPHQHPSALALPRLGLPGILVGVAPSGTWLNASFDLWRFRASVDASTFEGVAGISVEKSIKILPFVRLLAKIAHCLAVAMRGFGSFKPYLPDIILGKSDEAAYLIGGRPESFPPGQREHELALGEWQIGEKRLLFAHIRLFAQIGTAAHGTPVYYVIVGEAL